MRFRAAWLTLTLALVILGTAAVPNAQQPAKVARIGFLSPGSPTTGERNLEAFRQGLHGLGYVEGQNMAIEYRYAETRFERLPDLAADLLRLRVDVIVAVATEAVRAAMQATRTTPIVMPLSADPVEAGLVSSLARPGGNVTGLSMQIAELSGKRLELLKEAVPGVARAAVLWNPNYKANAGVLKATEAAAAVMGLQLQIVEVRGPTEFDGAFRAMVKGRSKVLFLIDDPLLSGHRAVLVSLAAKNRLPAISTFGAAAEAGLLMSYGPDVPDLFRRAAAYVDKILKGAKPADLPVEQPMRFQLVINLKTAKALGLTIPQSVLLRVDKVIH